MKNKQITLFLLLASVLIFGGCRQAQSEPLPSEKASAQQTPAQQTPAAEETALSMDEAMELLMDATTALREEMPGAAVVSNGEDTIDGEHCWLFALGKDMPEKFTAEKHFAVSDTGKIYYMDILDGGAYKPFE